MDIIRQQQKAEREEEERLKKEQEEKYRLEQEKKCPKVEEEEVIINTEYLVYICQCCDKMFKTTNAFKNHTESNKHKEKAKLYEEAGVIVTEVVLADELVNVDCDYNDDDDEEDELNVEDIPEEKVQDESDVEDTDEDDDYEFEEKKESAFSAFAAFSDSSSSSSSSSDEEDSDDDKDEVESEDHKPSSTEEEDIAAIDNDYYEDDLDLLEDIIYQNRLNEQLYPDDCERGSDKDKALALPPIAFDDDQYDPDKADRLEVVQHRLQKKLAAKGIEPNQIQPGYKCSDAVTIGKTLLQEVMAANVEDMQAKLALYKEHKREHQLLGREFKFAKGNSKALASQYSYRIDPSDNARARANVHHTGSHYHMAAARSMYYGRSKGLMARHSSQGSRLQASRMAAKETAKMHGKGGGKVGKISGKKSNMKRRGEAGGSKKCGGEGGE